MRSASSASVSMPAGGSPSTTPTTPRPSSVWAISTSTGFAVAHQIVQTSGTALRALRTLIGKPVPSRTMKECPAPMASALPRCELGQLLIVARAPNETGPRGLAERDPELEVRPGPGHGFVEILDRLHEMGLPDDDVETLWPFHGNRAELHVAPPSGNSGAPW